MKMQNINLRILKSFYTAMPELEDEEPLTLQSEIRSLCIDSLDMIAVMFEMEKEFELVLPIEEITPLKNLKAIGMYIQSKLAA